MLDRIVPAIADSRTLSRAIRSVALLAFVGLGVWGATARAQPTCDVIPTLTTTIDVAGAAFKGIAAAPDGSRVYLTVRVSGPERFQVKVIDTGTDTVIDTIELGEEGATSSSAGSLLIPETGGYAYATTYASNVIKIDLTTHAVVRSVYFPRNPGETSSTRGEVISPDGRYLFIANFDDDEVTVIDLPLMKVVSRIQVPSVINSIAISAGGDAVYAITTNDGSSTPASEPVIVTAIDVATLRDVGTLPIGTGTLANSGANARVSPDSRSLYVRAASMNEVVKVDLTRFIEGSGTTVPTGSENIQLTPDGLEVWFLKNGYGGDKSAEVIRASDMTIIDNIDTTGQAGRWLEFSSIFTSDGRFAILPLFLSEELLMIDAASHAVLDRVPVSGTPTSIVFLPDGSKAYLTSRTGSFTGNVLAVRIPVGFEPWLSSVEDVGNDQGRQVRVSWTASESDSAEYPSGCQVLEYGVWRRREPGLAPGSEGIENLRKAYPPGEWDFVATVPARGETSYSVVAPTLCDDTPAGDCESTFFVSAVTSDPHIYFDSGIRSGSSVDNLAPLPPQSMVVDYGASENALSWSANGEEDLAGYRLYKGGTPDFTPSTANLLAETGGTSWTDPAPDPWASHYKMSAFDINENESDITSPSTATAVEGDGSTGRRVVLFHPPQPNPFNPRTTLRFELGRATSVDLRIHDLLGRRVAVLAQGEMPEGMHQFSWSGVDESGSPVASGVYLATLRAAGQPTHTQRLVLLK